MFNPVIFQALAMAIVAFVLPLDVIGSAIVQFAAWCRAHPECDITPLVFGYFVEPGPVPPETLNDEIARLIDKMNEAAQNCDYPAWYEAAQEWNGLQHFEDLHPTRIQVAER